MGDFAERIDVLKGLIGDGTLTAKVSVDQIYSRAQKTGGWISGPLAGVRIRNHPRGGIEGFLGSQVQGTAVRDLHRWVADAIDERRTCAEGARDTVNELIQGVSHLAPVESGALRKSGAGTVTDNGRVVYDRPAEQPRLSKEELKARRQASGRSRPRRERPF